MDDRQGSKKAPPLRCVRSRSPANAREDGNSRKLGGEINDYQAGCARKVQVTSRGWNRFDAAKREMFLEWFAATCNAKEAARRAGVAYSTIYRTRMLDARFAEAWDRALEQGYARLEAKLLEMQFEAALAGPVEFDGGFEPPLPAHGLQESPSPAEGGGAEMDAPDPGLVDPDKAMQLLRQHKSEVVKIREARAADPRARGRQKEVPTYERQRLASDAEVRAALVKGLKAFGVRVTKEDMRGDEN